MEIHDIQCMIKLKILKLRNVLFSACFGHYLLYFLLLTEHINHGIFFNAQEYQKSGVLT